MFDWGAMDVTTFRRALFAGQGRALMCVRRLGRAPDPDALRVACLHCHTHDWGLEGHRAPWLWSLLTESGTRDQVVDTVIGAPPATSAPDADQRCGLLQYAAQAGHPQAEAALVAALHHQPEPAEALVGAAELITLHGVQGLLMVARVVGQRLRDGAPGYATGLGAWMMSAEDLLGSRTVHTALREAAQIDPRLGAVWDVWEDAPLADDPGLDPGPLTGPRHLTLPERARLVGLVRACATAWAAGRPLPVHEGDLAQALARLAREGLSELDPLLLVLDSVPNADLRRQLSRLLAWHRHPVLRALALEGPLGHPDRLRLLVANYAPGDHRLIPAHLDPDLAPDERHDVASILLRLHAAHGDVDWSAALLHAYGAAPSSLHREDALARLIDAGSAPDWVVSEACWDAHPAVAEVAQAVLQA